MVRSGLFLSGSQFFEPFPSPGILKTEELLEELLLLFRELRGGFQVHHHHQVARGFARAGRANPGREGSGWPRAGSPGEWSGGLRTSGWGPPLPSLTRGFHEGDFAPGNRGPGASG